VITVHVEPADRKYLNVQVGELSDFVESPDWQKLYEEHLWQRMNQIEPYLPDTVKQYCDIGGGLSGISILLNIYFGNSIHVNVIDGDAPPVVINHGMPFNSSDRTRAFLTNNQVGAVTVWSTHQLPIQRFELITSFRAWCFHVEPSAYLAWCVAHLSPRGCAIIDVRKDQPSWLTALRKAFANSQMIAENGKGDLWQFQL
jgi:hypothetical protein